MTRPAPLVSIVICTRNRAKHLDGMLAALSKIQSEHEWEALLVDNASTDDTAAILQRAAAANPRLRYLLVERLGLGAARDGSWPETRGEIVTFTDDDCYIEPNFVDALVEVFREHPAVGCVGGRILLYDPEDAPITLDLRDAPHDTPPRQFVRAGTLHGANLSFRREVLEQTGGFDPTLGAGTSFPCEDIDAVAAASWAGYPLRFDPRPVVYHHHRRRAADVPGQIAHYLKGSGAYYAKYLLRADSRRAYMSGWWRHALQSSPLRKRARMGEIWAAAAYLIHHKRYGFLLTAAPIGIAAYMALVAMVAYATLVRRSRQLFHPA